MTAENRAIIHQHRATWGTPPGGSRILERASGGSAVRFSKNGQAIPVITRDAPATAANGRTAPAARLDDATKMQLRLARVKLQLLSA